MKEELRKVRCMSVCITMGNDGDYRETFYGYFHKWVNDTSALVEKLDGNVEIVNLGSYYIKFIEEFPNE